MVDVWLIVTAVILSVLLLIISAFILVYFGHPDDKNEAYVPKIVVLFGLWLAFAAVLCLPYDVANTRGSGGDLRVDIMWQIVFITIAAMISIFIPFAYFFYESDVDPDEVKSRCESQFCVAIKYTFAFFIAFITILVILFFVQGEAQIPVHRYAVAYSAADTDYILDINSTATRFGCISPNCVDGTFTWVVPITFPVYVMAFLSFLGWWFFTMFVGVGLIALPLDLINEYRTRPEPMTFAEYSEQRKLLGERAAYLLQAGQTIQRERIDTSSTSRKERKAAAETVKKFEQAYYFLKRDYEVLRVSHELKGGNPVWYFFKLVLGVLASILSFTWFLHICIFVLPPEPVDPFLNTLFIELGDLGGGKFPLFGVCAFGLWSLYLLWACIKGNFKLGMRFLFWKVYPMELGNTMMNSFLANVWILLVCTIPTIQFCVQAFPVYARLTSVDMLLGVQAQYLDIFKYFWQNKVFIYAIVALNFFTLVYLFLWPNDKSKDIEKKLDVITRRNGRDSDDE